MGAAAVFRDVSDYWFGIISLNSFVANLPVAAGALLRRSCKEPFIAELTLTRQDVSAGRRLHLRALSYCIRGPNAATRIAPARFQMAQVRWCYAAILACALPSMMFLIRRRVRSTNASLSARQLSSSTPTP